MALVNDTTEITNINEDEYWRFLLFLFLGEQFKEVVVAVLNSSAWLCKKRVTAVVDRSKEDELKGFLPSDVDESPFFEVALPASEVGGFRPVIGRANERNNFITSPTVEQLDN